MRGRFAIFLVGTAIIFTVPLIIFGQSGPIASLRALLLSATAPLMRVSARAGRLIGYGVDELISAPGQELMERAMAIAAAEQDALRRENQSLRRALGLRDEFGGRLLAAEVLLYQSELGQEYLILDIGREAEVKEGDMVIDEERLLVGEVREVEDGFAKVSIASNLGAALPVELVPVGERALARGIGGRAFAVELIPHDTPLRPGDFLIWAPEERPGNPAIIIGQITGEAERTGHAFKTGRAVLLARPERAARGFVLIRR